MENEVSTYRIKFFSLLIAVYGASIWIFFIFILIHERLRLSRYELIIFAACMVLALVLSAIISALMVWWLKLQIGYEGIRGHNALGFSRWVRWDDINKVKRLKIAHLEYVRIFSINKTMPLWVPLFLRDKEAFINQVLEYAPEENPFRIQFEQNE